MSQPFRKAYISATLLTLECIAEAINVQLTSFYWWNR